MTGRAVAREDFAARTKTLRSCAAAICSASRSEARAGAALAIALVLLVGRIAHAHVFLIASLNSLSLRGQLGAGDAIARSFDWIDLALVPGFIAHPLILVARWWRFDLPARASVRPRSGFLSMQGEQHASELCRRVRGQIALCPILIPRFGLIDAAAATAVVNEAVLLFIVAQAPAWPARLHPPTVTRRRGAPPSQISAKPVH